MAQERDARIEELMRYYDYERRTRCFREELRKTKHALWIARALRAKAKVGEYVGEWCLAHRDYESKMETYWNNQQNKWRWVERKCLEKAKEFE